jgi:hypothetical protein
VSEEGARRLRDPAVREEYRRIYERLWEAQADLLRFIDRNEGLGLEKHPGLIDELIDVWNALGVFLANVYFRARVGGMKPEQAFMRTLSMLSDEAQLLFIAANAWRSEWRKLADLEP